MKEIHIGRLIEEELRRQERSVSWFARMLCCERTNVYNIFKRESIDCSMLYRISIILNRNFFDLYCVKIEEEFK
ncbi:MAG: XRE family transcriptional regulator [Prevotella sp.]|nr:XRE family transcriptional regulator [Prevotella sp.]